VVGGGWVGWVGSLRRSAAGIIMPIPEPLFGSV